MKKNKPIIFSNLFRFILLVVGGVLLSMVTYREWCSKTISFHHNYRSLSCDNYASAIVYYLQIQIHSFN